MSREALELALARCGEDWRAHLKEAARSARDLTHFGVYTPQEASEHEEVSARYETLISPYYLSLIDPRDPRCPIRLQAIPQGAELAHLPEEETDPIGDQRHAVSSILVHRYPDRALLFPTLRCPMFCRYCFRKEALNSGGVKLSVELPKALQYLDEHPEIEEVILSGGDPLMLSNERLLSLLQSLDQRGRRVRLHTRFPVTLPYRLEPALVEGLGGIARLNLVTHFNHPRELSLPALEGLSALRRAGVRVANQAVLLAGVNDDPEVLRALCVGLLDAGVTPYYLHHPDLTAGTQHLRVTLRRGLEITRSLRGRLSGLATPTYVIDVPRGGGKVPVDSAYVQPSERRERWTLISPLTGEEHPYIDLAERYSPQGQRRA